MAIVKTKIYFLSILFLFAFVFWKIFFNSLPYNVNTIEYDHRSVLIKITPEGWGFFTRSPREEMVDIYKKNGNEWEQVNFLNNSYTNLFGISRESRMIGMEISLMHGQIPDDSLWRQHKGIDSIQFPETFLKIENDRINLFEEGEYALLKQEIIPWSWRDKVENKHIRYEIIGIDYDKG